MRIKVACPHNTVTGGIELLHQVVAELNTYDGVLAELWYLVDPSVRAIPEEYTMYNTVVNNNVQRGDILLFPEIWARYTNQLTFHDHKKIVFWEGVNAYFPHTPQNLWFHFGEGTLHLSQTEYSGRFLRNVVNVPDSNIIEVTDYVNDAFLDADIHCERDKVVLYNPTKGMEFTEKLIALAPEVEFIPITGMNRQQIVELMKRSMVWVDLGDFPGKDRLPREAGACGMCLITSKFGSGKYHKDLGIPEIYKIDNLNYADLGAVRACIRYIFDNFEECQEQFAAYRKRLKQEKVQFKKGIKKLVERLAE